MKSILIAFFSLALLLQAAPPDEIAALLPKARELVTKKQYLAAYELVEKADPEHRHLEAVLFKFDLLWNYYASRIGADMFALRDLKDNEQIEDVRGEEGTFSMFLFETQKILQRLLEQHPDDPRLHRAIGHFHYKQAWADPDAKTEDGKSSIEVACDHLAKAVKGGADDDSTRFALGHMEMSRGKISESIPHFEKCIEFNPDYAAAHFNLASARFEVGPMKDALKPAKRAIELYSDPALKCDAASLTGDILAALGEKKESLRHYEMADEIQPDAYPNIKSLLLSRLQQDSPESEATALRLMNIDPENPKVFGDLEKVYMSVEKADKLIGIYKLQLESKAKDRSPVVTGNLHFYTARLYLESEPNLARQHFEDAKLMFEKEFPKDHQVFEAIDLYLEEK